MKAKQSFNAGKADAEEIQHVEIKPVAKAEEPTPVTGHQLKLEQQMGCGTFRFPLSYWFVNHSKDLGKTQKDEDEESGLSFPHS